MVIFWLFFYLVNVNAQHDHALHLSTEDMLNEIGVVAKMKQPELIKLMQKYKVALQHMEYVIDQCEENDKECYDDWWTKHGMWYGMSYDRMVIASHACHFLYDNDSKCDYDKSIWNSKIDKRDPKFNDELDLEIRQLMLKNMKDLRDRRNRSDDL